MKKERPSYYEKSVVAGKKRKCHDCGKPTFNYRCEECWEKLRAKNGIPIDGDVEGWDYAINLGVGSGHRPFRDGFDK